MTCVAKDIVPRSLSGCTLKIGREEIVFAGPSSLARSSDTDYKFYYSVDPSQEKGHLWTVPLAGKDHARGICETNYHLFGDGGNLVADISRSFCFIDSTETTKASVDIVCSSDK